MERGRNLKWLTDEFSGSLGDLGTFLPLVVALSATIQLDLGTTLLFSGAYNIMLGLFMRVPACVQPMKTIAAVALASPGLSLLEVQAAGLFVAVTMLLLGATGAMNAVTSVIPGSIVRGIQLAVGLSLAQKGVSQALMSGGTFRGWLGLDGLLLGLLCLAFLLATTIQPAACCTEDPVTEQQQAQQQHQQQQQEQEERQEQAQVEVHQAHHPQRRHEQQHTPASSTAAAAASSSSRVPSALIVVLVGLILTISTQPLSGLRLGPSVPHFSMPSWEQWRVGIAKAGFAQLPLTTLNSVVAVSALAGELFPDRLAVDGWRWRPGAVALSVGVMNCLGCWFGAFPMCSGSGGLAAQFKFGARSGFAPVLLGVLKIALALLFGSSLLPLLQHFPQPLLGGMLLISGMELAASARKQTDARGFSLMLLTAAAIIGLRDTAYGFITGLAGAATVAAYDYCFKGQLWQHAGLCWNAVAVRRLQRAGNSVDNSVKYTPLENDHACSVI